jgi:glycoside/pentoside/hexuronide:cation symporter, GPH family
MKKLSVGTKLGYGVCDLGGNLYFTVIAFWLLNYFTDTVGISAGLTGIIIMIGRMWDAVTDPVAGFLSDRTKSRWGRRRPWLLFGSFPLFLAMVAMFTNPGISHQGWRFVWGLGVFCLLSTFYTVVNIPYSSLTPELTSDFHEKTSLNGYRFGFAVLGTLIGAGAALPIVNAFGDKSRGFAAMGIIFGAVMMVSALVTFFSVREPGHKAEEIEKGFFNSYKGVFRNRPYRKILFTYTMHIVGVTVVSGILVYYYKYLFFDEGLTTIALLFLLLTAMVFIPVSVLVSKKIGKKLTYAGGMAIVAVVALLIAFAGEALGVRGTFALMILGGVGLSTTYAIPWSIMPDAIEWEAVRTGKRNEGAYYGIWTFCSKIGQALAIAVTGLILDLSGYIPEAVQSPSAAMGIRIILGPLTAVAFVAAIIILSGYPITEKVYAEMMEKREG